MRQKRAKTYRKLMHLYQISFGFREPYQVIIDDSFVSLGIQYKIDIVKQLSNVLQGTIKPMITQCCMSHLYATKNPQAIYLAKNFERRKCNHREAQPTNECIKSVIGEKENKHRYVVATQDEELRQNLRKIPGLPLVYINRSVMILEPPSGATILKQRNMEREKIKPKIEEIKFLNSVNSDKIAERRLQDAIKPGNSKNSNLKRKRKGPKEPNPLSIKKKKKKTTPSESNKNQGELTQ